MKRWMIGLPVALALVACGSTPSAVNLTTPSPRPSASLAAISPVSGADTASPEPSPSTALPQPSPAPAGFGARAVLVDLVSDPVNYTITLVDAEGNISRQITARKRTAVTLANGDQAMTLPYVSTTNTSLYYLDGDSTIKTVWLDGRTLPDITIPVGRGSELEFAVSPDDSVIAYALLDYTVNPVRDTLFTQTRLNPSPKAIFTTTSDYVWPVAWHTGLLVLAHPSGPYEESVTQGAPARDDPYSAISYHVVDSTNAFRKVLMGACTVSGPLSPAGSGCIQGGSIDWQGNTAPWSTNDWGSRSSAAALSPDGQWMAAANPNDPTQMGIWRKSDGLMANYAYGPGLHDWAGWIDDENLIVGSEDASWQPTVENVIHGGLVHPIAARGFFAALLPTNVV
jgi:hypothetical protein